MVLCMNRKRNEIYVVCEKNEGALVLNADDLSRLSLGKEAKFKKKR